jgi:PKD repeat protein
MNALSGLSRRFLILAAVALAIGGGSLTAFAAADPSPPEDPTYVYFGATLEAGFFIWSNEVERGGYIEIVAWAHSYNGTDPVTMELSVCGTPVYSGGPAPSLHVDLIDGPFNDPPGTTLMIRLHARNEETLEEGKAEGPLTIVPAPPKAPYAHASADKTEVAVGEPVWFSSEGSWDPDGYIASWYWEFGDGESSAEASPIHPYTAAGTYEVSLVVTDNDGLSSEPARLTITVTAANLPPVAVASADKTLVAVGEEIHFSSEGSFDPESGALAYSWDFGDGWTSASPNPAHAYEAGGHYSVALTVTDPEGASASATAAVTAVEVSFSMNPVMVGVSKSASVTATVIPSGAFDHVTFAVTEATIASVNPTSAVGPVQALTVNGVKKGTTFLEAFVGYAPCGKAAIAVGQMVVVRITPDPAYFAPGKRVTFTAVAFAPVQGCALIPKEYSPDLSTPIGAEVAVGEAKGIYLGPTPATWRLEGQGNKAAKALIPPDVPTEGVSSVQVEARPDAVGEIKPELSAYGCNEDCARGVVVAIEKIRYRRSGGAWKDAPEWLYVSKGETIEFTAVQEPAEAPWPANEPNWDGMASGTGPTATVVFDTVKMGTVSVSCGASSKLIYVAVVEAEMSAVASRVWFAGEIQIKGRLKAAPEGIEVPIEYTHTGDDPALTTASGANVLMTSEEKTFTYKSGDTGDGLQDHGAITFSAADTSTTITGVGLQGVWILGRTEAEQANPMVRYQTYKIVPKLTDAGPWPKPNRVAIEFDFWVGQGEGTITPEKEVSEGQVIEVTPGNKCKEFFIQLHTLQGEGWSHTGGDTWAVENE